MSELFAGLMSGTSLDGVDGVLADFAAPGGMKVLAHAYRAFPAGLREALLALNTSGTDELHRAALAGNALAGLYAEVMADLQRQSGQPVDAIRAVGAHGQTVRHQPKLSGGVGYTLQINNPSLLAELCGVDVVADFRSRDVAAGGQGAPLVPAFHRAMFGRGTNDVCVLNLGGFSNLTVLHANGETLGFDCGPANVLMDAWCHQHTGRLFDADGAWAASGKVSASLLSDLLAEPFFAAPAPKSTGRDLFNAAWLGQKLAQSGALSTRPEDVQATLCELTAVSCADAVKRFAPACEELLVCGGGALNGHLMGRLAKYLPRVAVDTTDARGLPAQQVEACAFAWLARAHVQRQAGNLISVTGAAGPRVLGALYPAN